MGRPVSWAITEPSPIWTVYRAGRPQYSSATGACQMVWPWEPIRSTSAGVSPAFWMTASAAWA